jgi:hypothetical protein
VAAACFVLGALGSAVIMPGAQIPPAQTASR